MTDQEKIFSKLRFYRGAWVAQSVKHQTSAQVMNLQFVGFSPSWLCADRSEPGACSRFCVSLSL